MGISFALGISNLKTLKDARNDAQTYALVLEIFSSDNNVLHDCTIVLKHFYVI